MGGIGMGKYNNISIVTCTFCGKSSPTPNGIEHRFDCPSIDKALRKGMNKEYKEARENIWYILSVKSSQRCGTERCHKYTDCNLCLTDQILSLSGDGWNKEQKLTRILVEMLADRHLRETMTTKKTLDLTEYIKWIKGVYGEQEG
jgi:hypothetical protein